MSALQTVSSLRPEARQRLQKTRIPVRVFTADEGVSQVCHQHHPFGNFRIDQFSDHFTDCLCLFKRFPWQISSDPGWDGKRSLWLSGRVNSSKGSRGFHFATLSWICNKKNVRNLLSSHVVTRQGFSGHRQFYMQLQCMDWNCLSLFYHLVFHKQICMKFNMCWKPQMDTQRQEWARKEEREEGSFSQRKEVNLWEFKDQHFINVAMSDWGCRKEDVGVEERQKESVWISDWVSN